MTTYRTEQEAFWSGAFGDEYSTRNTGAGWVAANTALFTKILARTSRVGSVIEFGANIGLNLRALRRLLPAAHLAAVEINASAVETLRDWVGCEEVIHDSILNYEPTNTYDLSFTKGVLIHINPDELASVYETLYRSSHRYILVAEYYNPSPVEVPYRGHSGRLFKRDFAGEILDRYSDLRLVDYGFAWKRDPNFPQDDLTWFLMEK
jgi:spore coat polysaccharide biosynthesis protein SpsF